MLRGEGGLGRLLSFFRGRFDGIPSVNALGPRKMSPVGGSRFRNVCGTLCSRFGSVGGGRRARRTFFLEDTLATVTGGFAMEFLSGSFGSFARLVQGRGNMCECVGGKDYVPFSEEVLVAMGGGLFPYRQVNRSSPLKCVRSSGVFVSSGTVGECSVLCGSMGRLYARYCRCGGYPAYVCYRVEGGTSYPGFAGCSRMRGRLARCVSVFRARHDFCGGGIRSMRVLWV